MNLEELVSSVVGWSISRGIFPNSTPQAQLLKCLSEVGELADATLKGNQKEVEDGIGDTLVTLIIYARLQDMNLTDCLAAAWEQIKDRRGYLTPEGVFVKEVSNSHGG
jgi:hypothetical protein